MRGFHLADLFTLGNAACGVASVFMAMAYLNSRSVTQFLVATAFAPLALLFDVLDGRIARWRQTQSPLGRELDSVPVEVQRHRATLTPVANQLEASVPAAK